MNRAETLRPRRGLHQITPLTAVVLLAALITAVLTPPGLLLPAAALVVIAALAALSGEGAGRFLRRIRFVMLFSVVLFVAQALSIHAGQVLISSPVLVTTGGIVGGLRMALRFIGVLGASFLFVTVVDPDRLAQTLIRIGVPYRYGYLLILALRFVPFFEGELAAIRDAQRVRGIQVSVRSPRRLIDAVHYTFIPVLVSALSRVDSISISMKSRGFGLHPRRTVTQEETWSRWDAWTLGVAGGLMGAAIWLKVTKGGP